MLYLHTNRLPNIAYAVSSARLLLRRIELSSYRYSHMILTKLCAIVIMAARYHRLIKLILLEAHAQPREGDIFHGSCKSYLESLHALLLFNFTCLNGNDICIVYHHASP